MNDLTREEWESLDEVDWQADQSGVLSITLDIEAEYMNWRSEELADARAHVHINNQTVNLYLNNDGDEIEADEPRTSAALNLSPEEAQRLGKQLQFAGENAEEMEDADVRT